jgi:hypothetical protein
MLNYMSEYLSRASDLSYRVRYRIGSLYLKLMMILKRPFKMHEEQEYSYVR